MRKGFMDMCRPMASKITAAAGKPGFPFAFAVPGVLLILAGALILTEPRVLVWLMAGTSMLLGVFVLVAAPFMRRMMAQRRGPAVASQGPVGKASGCAG